MADYDLIVVGAGPAGSSLALQAARRGLSVMVLDKAPLPRDKVCGDTLSSLAVAGVRELGLMDRLLAIPHTPVAEIAYHAPDGSAVTVPLARIDPQTPVTSLVCRRVLFDDMLQQAARERTEFLDWCRVTEVLAEDGRAVGVRAEQGGGREFTATARVVAGADGVHSVVARSMGMPGNAAMRTLGVRAYYRQVLGMQGSLEVHFLKETLPGYLWIHPTESGMTNVGVSMPLDAANEKRTKPKRVLESALASPALAERFRDAEQVSGDSPGVGLMPVADPMREIHGPGFVLVGDAAGLVRPCSTLGIPYALLSARIAAEVVAEAIAKDDTGDDGLRPYPYRLWKEIGPMVSLSNRLLALRTPKAISSLIRSAARRPHNAAWISGILLGLALPSEELDDLLSYLDFFTRT